MAELEAVGGMQGPDQTRRQRRTRNRKKEQRPARSGVFESRQSLILRDQAEGESREGRGREMDDADGR